MKKIIALIITEGPHSNDQKNSFVGIDYIIFK